MLKDLASELSLVLIEKKELEKKEKALKENILKEMESRNMLGFENEYIKIKYMVPSKRVSLDTAKLKKLESDLYDELMDSYKKETTTKPSLRVTLYE